MMKIDTVNVIEYYDGTVSSLTAFNNDEAGIEEADKLFLQIARENNVPDEELDSVLDDGEVIAGDYQLLIIFSNTSNAGNCGGRQYR